MLPLNDYSSEDALVFEVACNIIVNKAAGAWSNWGPK